MWWLLLLLLGSGCRGEGLERPPLAEGDCGGEECGLWAETARAAQRQLAECRTRTGAFASLDQDLVLSAIRMKNCLKENFLRSLDLAVAEKELPLSPFLTLIRTQDSPPVLADPRRDAINEDLISSIYKRFSRLLDTHSFKFNFSQLWTKISTHEENEADEDREDGDEESSRSWERQSRQGLIEGMDEQSGGALLETLNAKARPSLVARGFVRRRRQQYRKAFPMMVAGYMMMSAFLVPLGFQFMAMLGGKALLLAKMAFFMSLFSGYKRLTNDIEYHHHPLHHGGHEYLHHYPHFHHRSSHEVPGSSQGQGLFSQMMPSSLGQLGGQLGGQFGISRKDYGK